MVKTELIVLRPCLFSNTGLYSYILSLRLIKQHPTEFIQCVFILITLKCFLISILFSSLAYADVWHLVFKVWGFPGIVFVIDFFSFLFFMLIISAR